MRTSFLACVLTVTLACLTAACGGDGGSTSTPASEPAGAALDPCTLVTKAEADQALGAGASEAKIGFQTVREQPIDRPEAVSNLGEDAFWMANQLHVLKGTRYLIVTGDFSKATGEALAKKALERLG